MAGHGLMAVAVGLSLALLPRAASAYRPFDGTDAAVVNVGKFELELGPMQWLRRANQSYVIAPQLGRNSSTDQATAGPLGAAISYAGSNAPFNGGPAFSPRSRPQAGRTKGDGR